MKILHSFSNTFNKITTIESASNYYVNTDQKQYLDFISGLYNCPLGSSEKIIKNEIINAMESLPNSHLFSVYPGLSQTNFYVETLTTKLQELVPFGKSVIYTNSGAEAVDVALTECINITNRKKIISYRNSYHGSTSLSHEVSGNINTTIPNRIYVDFYDFNSSLTKEEYLTYIEDIIASNDPASISCFIIEPMIGASGGFLMKQNVLPEISKICKKYGILIILDEIISGFGRLSNMFAFEEYNIEPDILLLSKQITNGYMPLGVCILSNSFNFENKDIKRGSTTAGNPISCAAANASINLIQQSFLSRKRVEKRLKEFSNMFIHESVYKFEHCGCFASLHFSQSKDNLKLFNYNIGGEIAKMCYEKGLIIRGNPKSIILAPGFNMTDLQIDFAIKTIMDSINELLE